MNIESLEHRVLFSAAGPSTAAPALLEAPTHRVSLHHDSTPKVLPISILGSYDGDYDLSTSGTFFSAATMIISQQKPRSFRGTLTLDRATRRFTATLSTYKVKGPHGPGYYAVTHYVGDGLNVRLVGAIVPGQDNLVPGFTAINFWMTGMQRGAIYPIRSSDGAEVSLYPDSQATAP